MKTSRSSKITDFYGIRQWGNGYFDILPNGDVGITCVGAEGDQTLSLYDIVVRLQERGLELPILLRFSDILRKRLDDIYETFDSVIKRYNYQNGYRGVYPIKVNQQAQVLDSICKYGARYGHGLEAGSKAELLIAMAMSRSEDSLIITNGYKDAEFIDLGLMAKKLGIQCVFVVESPREVNLIVERSRKMDVEPDIGLRCKLSSTSDGHWKDSGGDQSVFGLSTSQIIDAVDELKRADMLHCVKLLHYHLGSQLPNIADIRRSIIEASRMYVGLIKEGAPLGMLDLGGGLAVDYTGLHSHDHMSMNYSIHEYCSAIVEGISEILNESKVSHPMIITEAGRATVAYYSVLIFNILDVSHPYPPNQENAAPEPDDPDSLKNIFEVESYLTLPRLQECYHDILHYRDDIRQLFKIGKATLRQRARAERQFWKVLLKIKAMVDKQSVIPKEFETLTRQLSSVYYANFSLFQSLPDSWAIDQLFPIMPIHRLKEEPTENAILSDITCDCDGMINTFVTQRGLAPTLKLHDLKENDSYYLGVFLVGAYQETLGDLHNLFGDTHVVSVELDKHGNVDFSREVKGDTVADVLSYVEYDTKDILKRFGQLADKAVLSKRITQKERRQIVDTFDAGLQGYTYYEGHDEE